MRWRKFLRALGIFLAVLFLIVAVGPFLVPVSAPEGTRLVSDLADPDSQFVEIDGVTVHFKARGQGERAFILLHGFGASLFSWHSVMEPLSQYGRVIAYDRPAFGLTERPMTWEGENPYSSASNVALLLGLIDHFGFEKVILVGNSAGATVSMEFFLEYPDRVEALILVDPAVYGGGGGPAWIQSLAGLPQLDHLGPLIVRSIQKRGLDILETAWYDPSRISQETRNGYTKPLMAENWDRALWYFSTAERSVALENQLDRFIVPSLVITGDTDRIVPTENSIKLGNTLPNATLVVIPEAGHVPHEEQPADFMQAVTQFLNSLP